MFWQSVACGSGSIPCSEMAVDSNLKDHGYMYVKQAIPREIVQEARKVILNDMKSNGFTVGGEIGSERQPELLSRQDLASHPAIQAVTEHANLVSLFAVGFSFRDRFFAAGFFFLDSVPAGLFDFFLGFLVGDRLADQ